MKIIEFKGCNLTYAQDQPEYLPLPVYKTADGEVTSCWGLSFFEKIRVVLTGRIWLNILTFNKPLQPQKMMSKKPF